MIYLSANTSYVYIDYREKIMKFEKKRKSIFTEKGTSFYPIEKCNSIFELISIIFHDYLKFRIHINTDFTI